MLTKLIVTLLMLLAIFGPTAFLMAQPIDCSPLDPRASISKEKEGKVEASVDTLFKIAKAGGGLEGKIKEEIQNLQVGSSVSEQGIIKLRTLYLFCGMVANAKDLSTERKVELFRVMMDFKEPSEPKSSPRQQKKEIHAPPKAELESFKTGVFGILVSSFNGSTEAQNAKGTELQWTIISNLNARFAELGIQSAQARAIPPNLSRTLNSHQAAIKIGKEYGAAMLIWGDVTLIGVIPNITILDPMRDFYTIIKPETTLLKDELTFISLSQSKQIRLPPLTEEPTKIVCFAIAFKYYTSKDFAKALEFFKAALPDTNTKYIDSAPIFFYIGNIMSFNKEYDKAIDFYNKTIELNSLFTMAFNNRGACHWLQKQKEQALSDFNQSLKIDPDLYLAYNNRGLYYHALGEFDKALSDYAHALAIDPEYFTVYYNRAYLYNEMKLYDKALLDYDKALTFQPNNAAIYNNRALVYDAQKEKNKALSDLNLSIKLNPKLVEAYFNRGNILKKMGKYEQAICDYGIVLQANPNDVRVYNNRGNIYKDMTDYAKALSDFNNAIRIDPGSAFSLNNRGCVYQAIGEHDKAINDFTTALEIDRNYWEACLNRGGSYVALKDYKQAISDFTKALEINPASPKGYYNRGLAYQGESQFDRAMADYDKAIQSDPKDFQAFNNRGNIYLENKGEWDLAISDYTKALAINPKFAESYYNRGNAYYSKREYDRAIANYTHALDNTTPL